MDIDTRLDIQVMLICGISHADILRKYPELSATKLAEMEENMGAICDFDEEDL